MAIAMAVMAIAVMKTTCIIAVCSAPSQSYITIACSFLSFKVFWPSQQTHRIYMLPPCVQHIWARRNSFQSHKFQTQTMLNQHFEREHRCVEKAGTRTYDRHSHVSRPAHFVHSPYQSRRLGDGHLSTGMGEVVLVIEMGMGMMGKGMMGKGMG